MKKVIIFVLIFIFLITASALCFVFNQKLELEKEVNDLTEYYSNRNCLPRSIEELISEYGDSSIGLTRHIIFASAENFKKGIPSDLPEGFLFHPGADLNQVFSFPYPYYPFWGLSKSFLFPFNEDPDEITDFYLKIACDNNWEIIEDKQNPKFRIVIFNSETNTQRMIVAFKVINLIDDATYLPVNLNIKGQGLIIFRYNQESKNIEDL